MFSSTLLTQNHLPTAHLQKNHLEKQKKITTKPMTTIAYNSMMVCFSGMPYTNIRFFRKTKSVASTQILPPSNLYITTSFKHTHIIRLGMEKQKLLFPLISTHKAKHRRTMPARKHHPSRKGTSRVASASIHHHHHQPHSNEHFSIIFFKKQRKSGRSNPTAFCSIR